MRRHFALFKKTFALELAKDMAYKANFFIKFISLIFLDLVGPLIMLIIYKTTSGLPGWTFEEFILFQGTLTFVFGFGHAFLVMFPGRTINSIRGGTFDRFLLNPFNTLLYFLLSSVNIEGIAEMLTGLALIVWASIKLGISVVSLNFLFYVLLILCAFMFQYAAMIFVSAAGVLFIKSHALIDIYYRLAGFARYPLDIYGSGLNFMLTFVFPVAICAYFPVQVLLHGFKVLTIAKVLLPVVGFLILAIFMWKAAMKKYVSAGG